MVSVKLKISTIFSDERTAFLYSPNGDNRQLCTDLDFELACLITVTVHELVKMQNYLFQKLYIFSITGHY